MCVFYMIQIFFPFQKNAPETNIWLGIEAINSRYHFFYKNIPYFIFHDSKKTEC